MNQNRFPTVYGPSAINTTDAVRTMYLNDLHIIKCSANKSQNVYFPYYWTHEIGGAILEIPFPILPAGQMNSPGVYICIAKYHLGRSNDCFIKAMELKVIKTEYASSLATAQPAAYLRDILKEICNYIASGKNRGTYELKEDFDNGQG